MPLMDHVLYYSQRVNILTGNEAKGTLLLKYKNDDIIGDEKGRLDRWTENTPESYSYRTN